MEQTAGRSIACVQVRWCEEIINILPSRALPVRHTAFPLVAKCQRAMTIGDELCDEQHEAFAETAAWRGRAASTCSADCV